MGYVQAGYCFVLGILFLYGVQLLWRRRRLNRAVARVVASGGTHAVRSADRHSVTRPPDDR